MQIITALVIALVATSAIFQLGFITRKLNFNLSTDAYLDRHGKYQIALFLLASLVLILTYAQNPENFSLFFSIGNLDAPAEKIRSLGISASASWLPVGLSLATILTSGTIVFVFFQLCSSTTAIYKLRPYVGWILLFALANSFSEEMIFRMGLVSPLYGVMDLSDLMLVSAIIFGIAHFGGMPHGPLGMLMAGILGWFLANSMIETHGLLWAWFIHFVQDVVIYTGMMLWRIGQMTNTDKVYFGGN